jgi:hypothetical protein
MIDNLADIVWEGSEGIMVEPEFRAKFGAQLLLLSDWADSNWQQVTFPPSVRENIKLYNMTIIEGNYYVIPQKVGMPHFGAVVTLGDTLDEAINECKRIAEMVEGHLIDKPVDALDAAAENLEQIMTQEQPKSNIERKADGLRASGRISMKQYEKMTNLQPGE